MFNLSRENPNQISPRDTVLLMIRGFQISQCIYAAVKLRLLDLLGDGSKHYQELATETNTHADSLYRLLRTLVSLGILQENQLDYFQNTSLAAYLRDDQVGTLRNWLITEIEESYACWGNFTQSLTTGEGAFKAMYGLDIEEYHRENPSLNKVYDQSMNDITTFQIAKILEAYDFSSVEVLADIGGGQGKLIAAILKRYPQIKGILFEQPYSLEKAKNLLKQEGVSERCELISGDFFESVPVVADVYLLKQVLLSWNDQQVVDILKNCRQYMPSTSRLLIAERIIRKIYWRDNLADLQLWMLHSGKIRSENELKVLLTSAGFQIDKIIDTMPVQSLIEASPLPKLDMSWQRMSNQECIPDFKIEAILNPDISFDSPLKDDIDEPKSIFLTGATGFLGAYLLRELIDQTTANIYCLIRCHTLETGKQRLKENLQSYQLWQQHFDARIIPMVGDLAQPLLGLSEKEFCQLATEIDVIYHNGSENDLITPYSQMKAVNVLGTQEILKLAGLRKTKPVHFISTVTIFFSQVQRQDTAIRETDFPLFSPSLNTGYKQSKWVAEELIHLAQKRGLPVSIYRPTRIMGDSKTGIYRKSNNFFFRFIQICIKLEKFPTFDVDINIIPIDYASKAIVYLSRQKQLLGKTFHLVNPESISWQRLFELINACGYATEAVSDKNWLVMVENYLFEQGGEKAVSSWFPIILKSAKMIGQTKPRFDACQTIEGLAHSSIVCHPLDLSLISTYLLAWKKYETKMLN